MKTKLFFTLLILIAFAAAGQARNRNNAGISQDYPYSEKDDYIKDIRNNLEIIDIELKTLGNEADKLKDAAGKDTKQKIDALKERSSGLSKIIEKADDSSERGWGETKSIINRDYRDLKRSVDRMRVDMDRRVAPGSTK